MSIKMRHKQQHKIIYLLERIFCIPNQFYGNTDLRGPKFHTSFSLHFLPHGIDSQKNNYVIYSWTTVSLAFEMHALKTHLCKKGSMGLSLRTTC